MGLYFLVLKFLMEPNKITVKYLDHNTQKKFFVYLFFIKNLMKVRCIHCSSWNQVFIKHL